MCDDYLMYNGDGPVHNLIVTARLVDYINVEIEHRFLIAHCIPFATAVRNKMVSNAWSETARERTRD